MIRHAVRCLSAYKPPIEGRAKSGCRLFDFNERTIPVDSAIREAIQEHLEADLLHVYPDYGGFEQELAAYAGVAPEEVMITNGSDQGIDIVFRSCAEPGEEAIIPTPTFAMLLHSAEICGLSLRTPHYSIEQGYPLEEVVSLVNDNTRIVVVCNPNSPTGTLLEPKKIVDLANHAPHASILVDECYFEFSRTTIAHAVRELPNLFVTRTFSKTWGLPSLRIGYIVSSAENIENLLKVRGPYDVNTLAVVAARAALRNPGYMERYVREVCDVSKPMLLEFLRRKNICFWPTEGNFVLIYPHDASALASTLRENGILVRPRSGPGIDGTVRITIGTKEDTEFLIGVLERIGV